MDYETTDAWLASERETFSANTPQSAADHDQLTDTVPAGVCSTFRAYDPHPLHAERAEGVSIVDVDDNEYLDFALNNGTQLIGHAHPDLQEALSDQMADGTLYTRPNDRVEAAASALVDRIGPFEAVRFTNSGTEAVMHMTRLARAYTGREKIIKMEGAYHGAHDLSLVSRMPPIEQAGPADDPTPVIESQGIPDHTSDEVLLGQYNDASTVESHLREHGDEVAGILVEPACFNLGLVEPDAGFLERLRELADQYNTLLLFDEVKTALKLGPRSGADYYGVQPDLAALAKAIGGGIPVGAFGGRTDVMEQIEQDLQDGVATGAAHYGTYNGNPLAAEAVRVTLEEIATPEQYDRLEHLGQMLADGYETLMADHGVEGHVASVGTQGMVYFTDDEITTFRDWEHIDEELHEAYWFAMLNQGVIPHPHDASQQWTISIQHSKEDIEAHLDAFAEVAPTIAAVQST